MKSKELLIRTLEEKPELNEKHVMENKESDENLMSKKNPADLISKSNLLIQTPCGRRNCHDRVQGSRNQPRRE